VLSEDLPAQLTEFRVGSVLAGYRLEKRVGRGGFAVVFRPSMSAWAAPWR
jgi:hypothetical protein